MYDIIAQAVGIIAMIFTVISFQQKNKNAVIALQLVGTALFSINYFMLGAMVGCLVNALGVLRAIVYLDRKRFCSDKPFWLIFFIAGFIGAYVLTFTVFEKEFTLANALLEALPIIAMILFTVGYHLGSAKMIRRFALFCSPLWLTYNIANLALGATLCEVISLCSIVVGMIRHDRKKSND